MSPTTVISTQLNAHFINFLLLILENNRYSVLLFIYDNFINQEFIR